MPARKALPHVALISQWYAPEFGDGNVPRTIAVSLSSRGHEVDVLTGFPNYPEGRLYPGYRLRPYQCEIRDALRIHRAPAYFSHDTNAKRRAATYLSFAAASTAVGLARLPQVDVSLVYSSPITAAIPALALRRLRGTPYVLLVQDMWPQSVTASGFLHDTQTRFVASYLQKFCDHVYGRAAQIAVTSPGMIDLIAERGIAREKLHFVPNATEERYYYPQERDESVARELGLSGSFRVMYAGNFGEMQALDQVLAAARIVQGHAEIQFAFVGQGAMESSLRSTAQSYGLTNTVFLPPVPVQRMAAVLASADIHIVSLKHDELFRCTIPSKIQSLLAAGQPILGIVAGDAATVLREAGAEVIPPRSGPVAIADGILRYYALSADALARRRELARAHYLAHFSSDFSSERLSGLLSQACTPFG